ncbi:MAG: glycosyltransferase [Bacteroidales bacterium]|nr:glycosyltransferase [Bacteroidales bacterium]MDD4671322.1 glycosyltransferase [Bacteroidales bacterium]
MIDVKGNERVLVCPLGWGLGHATRVIPIISSLLTKGCTVIIAADKGSAALLRARFPNLEYIRFPSLKVKFTKGKLSFFTLICIANGMLLLTIREHSQIKRLVNKHQIDFILSDNRYGLWLKGTRSALITHQLNILFPFPFKWLQPLGQRYVRKHAQQFTECLVPDRSEGIRLTGKLTEPKKLPRNVRFIGVLSRFADIEIDYPKTRWDMLGIVSGPEPQRQILESILIDLANKLGVRSLILQGLPAGKHSAKVIGKATLVPHLPDLEIANAISSAKNIVCRSGYSTIMDLITLKRKAVLVPTPGQTEQEYLARYLSQHFGFTYVKQCKLIDICLNPNYSSE